MNRILGQALCAPHPVEHSLRKQIGQKEKLADYTQAITNAKLIYTVRHCKIGGSYLAVLVPSPPKRTNFKTKGHTSMPTPKNKKAIICSVPYSRLFAIENHPALLASQEHRVRNLVHQKQGA